MIAQKWVFERNLIDSPPAGSTNQNAAVFWQSINWIITTLDLKNWAPRAQATQNHKYPIKKFNNRPKEIVQIAKVWGLALYIYYANELVVL